MTSRNRLADGAQAAKGAFRTAALALCLSATVLLATAQTTPAAADPPLTVAEAKAQIEQLQTDAAAIDQDYAGVQEQIQQSEAKLKLKQRDVRLQAAKVAAMKRQVGQVALAEFQNSNLDTTAQLFFNEDTEGFLNQISTMQKVNENSNSVLQDYQQQQASLADLQASTRADLAQLQKKEDDLKALHDSSEKKIADAKAVLNRLTSAQQQQVAQENTDQTVAAQKEAEASPVPAGSGRGAKALAFAKAQIGKPYRFGGTGPGAYDCSGLTGASWRAAGVSLSRTSQAQYHNGRAVSRADLQPGDLVFFYSGLSHVAIYAGNGMVVHAPHPGASVQYIKMKYMPYVGARRPG